MIITTNIRWVVGTRCNIQDDVATLSIENVVTGGYDEIGIIRRVDGEWPNYATIRSIIVQKLLYNQTLSWEIARFVCRELRVPVENPLDNQDFQTEDKPLISAVPQPGGGLSDAQIANAARSAGASLHRCLIST